MRKLLSLFTSMILVTAFFVVPAQAVENNQPMGGSVYGACEGAGSDDPTDILSCNGHR